MSSPIPLNGITGETILITGHTGFKGVWLTLLLEKLGFEVFGASLAPESNSLFQKMNRIGKIEEIFLDICDSEGIYRFAKARKPGIIFHLAAQPLVKSAYEDPVATFKTNVIGTVNILEVARQISSVKAVGIVTTDKVYENDNSGIRFKESDRLGGNEPYSASKVAAEAAVSAWHAILGTHPSYKLMTFRSGNVIGGGDLSDARIIPDLVRHLYNQKPLILRNSEATRPWQHVLDPLAGYIKALNYAVSNEKYEKSFNFGPNEPSLTVGNVVKIFMHESGINGTHRLQTTEPEFHESITLELDNSLARKYLNWNPVWNQEDAIRKTAQWWSKIYLNDTSPADATNEDISDYLQSDLLK